MLEKLQKKLSDVLAAITGKTFVSMRGYCFHCKQDFHIELYQDFIFPVQGKCGCADGCRFDLLKFNGLNYHPSVKSELRESCPDILENCRTGR